MEAKFDTYKFLSSENNPTEYIKDIREGKNMLGTIEIDEKTIGNNIEATEDGIYKEGEITYEWDGISGSTLTIKYGTGSEIKIDDFKKGDLGINFED